MRQPTVRYQSIMMDSARWDGFPFRDGDIVISTPAKCGTTWTQMICALLIFQTPDFPDSLEALSPWFDMLTRRRDELVADLQAQRHRRFIKTHTPLDGLPFDERVTYICVGRDPRDAAISWDNHFRNTDIEALMKLRAAAVGAGDGATPEQLVDNALPAPTGSPRDRFWAWVDNQEAQIGLAAMLHHLSVFWAARQSPNVVLLHYSDLKADLAGQMRGLAARLGIAVPEEKLPELVRAATFDYMRGRADRYAPETAIWRDPGRFFHRGTEGQWADLLDADDLRRYAARVAELAPSDLATWLHRPPTPA